MPPLANTELETLHREAVALLGDRGPSARFAYLMSNDIFDLARAIAREGGSLLLIERDNALLTERDAQRLLDAIDCPVVLVT